MFVNRRLLLYLGKFTGVTKGGFYSASVVNFLTRDEGFSL